MAIPNQTIMMNHVGSVQEDIAMGVRSEDFRFLADVLNGLYSDTIAAPVREMSTNAWDSHVDAGVTRPIEITLPTSDRLEFVIQDFGLGMSVDDLRNTYSMYGASSKRGSNAVAGQLGLGSKSPLSYADAFTVSAVKGGVKTIAMVTKDEHGIGVIKILDTVVVDEPNGVRITIPVDRHDVDDFRQAAANLFQFWSPGTVLIDGEPPAPPAWLDTALRLDEDTWIVRPDAGLYRSYVIMGNVAYPVSDATVGRTSRRFVARLNIGDVDFVPSREEVKHTRHTDQTLAELAEYISENFDRALNRALSVGATRWDETMLKTMWMDRSLNLRADSDRMIWTYNPGIKWGRKAQGHLNYSLAKVAQASSTWVVTGFTAKNVSQAARERLVEFAGDKANFIIIPDTVGGVHQLEGRPNTVAWAKIVGDTSKPKAAKAARGPKVETRYTTLSGPSMTADELAAVSGQVLFLHPGESARYGTMGATVVRLYSSNQLPRITRYVPSIRHYYEEAQDRKAAALKAVTAQDRRIVLARSLPSIFGLLDPNKVDDPELAEYIALSKAADTDTLTAVKEFGMTPNVTETLPDFLGRYPLMSGGGYYHTTDKTLVNERLFYVNAKYASIIEAEAQEVAS